VKKRSVSALEAGGGIELLQVVDFFFVKIKASIADSAN
jgi:hypothetical protein